MGTRAPSLTAPTSPAATTRTDLKPTTTMAETILMEAQNLRTTLALAPPMVEVPTRHTPLNDREVVVTTAPLLATLSPSSTATEAADMAEAVTQVTHLTTGGDISDKKGPIHKSLMCIKK